MEILSFSVRVFKAGQQKRPRPLPGHFWPDKRDEAFANPMLRGTTRFPPAQGQAALKRRNGAQPSCASGPQSRSRRPLRSELQPARTRKPSQPVKLLSLPCGTDLLSPSLRLGVFRFYNQELCYHISGQFARAVQLLSAKIAFGGCFFTKPQPL